MLKNNIIFFIGILAFASSNLHSDFDLLKINDIQRLLKDHEKIHKRHHSPKLEGNPNPMNIETLNLIFKHNKANRDESDDRSDLIKEERKVNKILCAITGTYGCGVNNYLYELEASDSFNKPKRDQKEKPIDNKDSEHHKHYETEAKNDIQLLLNKEKQWLVDEHKELRCRGDRCGRERDGRDEDDDNDDRNEGLRCRGNRCGRGWAHDDRSADDRRDDYNSRNEGLRCRGNRCGRGWAHDRSADDRRDDDRRDDDNSRNEGLRCRGNRCGRGWAYDDRSYDDRRDDDRRDDDNSRNEGLRCRGSRCGRGWAHDDRSADDRRDDDRRDDDNSRNEGLRCRGNRCGRGWAHDDRSADDRRDDDRRDDDSRDDDNSRNEGLRCRGNRCGKGWAHDDRSYDDSRNDEDSRNEGLRCRGNRCERYRTDDFFDDEQREDARNEDLRCSGNRCGGNRDDDIIKTDENDRNEDSDLRCKGNRCGRSGTKIDADIENDFRLILDNHGQRYKLNNELDVIVLDADRLQEVPQLLDESPKKSKTARDAQDKDKMRRDKRISKKTYNNLSDSKFKLETNSPDPYAALLTATKIDNKAEERKVVIPRDIWDKIIAMKQKPLKKQGLRLRTGLLPLTMNQKKKLSQSSLRNEKKKTPIPFVIEVNGIGQVNPKPE